MTRVHKLWNWYELYSVVMASREISPAQQKKSSAILDAARRHFAEHGFEATKLSQVASDAGVAVGTIYLRYQGKAELLGGVLDHVEASFCDAIDTPDVWGAPFPERFHLIIEAILTTAQQETDLARLMALSPYAAKPTAKPEHRILQMIEQHMRDGVARDELRDDLDIALGASMAYGMVDGAMRELMSNPARNPSETVTHIADAYSRWLLGA